MHLHYLSILFHIPSIMGHGNMIRPRTWWNPEGWDGNHVGCGVLDLPDTEFEHHNSHASAPDCMDFWFSNHVEIPGHETLPDHVSQPEVKCIGQAGHHDDDHKFPWWSPGTTKIFGSCGTLGGIPAGCNGGYTYRLCKMPHNGIKDLTEECFQENQLDFVGD